MTRMPLMTMVFLASALLVGAGAFAAEPIEVFAGIPPVGYLAERVGGEYVHVEVLIEPGQDPHTYEPTPRKIQALGRAKLFFKVGMPFENELVEKISGAIGADRRGHH